MSGLSSDLGLDAVEATMLRLGAGDAPDRLGDIAAEHLAGGGKRVRARLALAAAGALGLAAKDAVPWAAACELLHNATLVHDDVQDGDAVRRGRPSVWALHGVAQAINAGDLLLMLPFRALESLRCDDATRWRLASAVARAAEAAARGQALELDLRPDRAFDPELWTRAAEGKSGALFGLPVEGAMLLARRDPEEAARVGREFARLGLLYQLADDVLDLYGDKGREAPGNDLREGKVSALVVDHLRLHPGDRARIVALLDAPRAQTDEAELAWAVGAFREGGALDAVRARIRDLAGEIARSPVLRDLPEIQRLSSGFVSAVLDLLPEDLRP